MPEDPCLLSLGSALGRPACNPSRIYNIDTITSVLSSASVLSSVCVKT